MVEYACRKVLVTGGTGFIGGRLAERLALEAKAKVRVLVHDWRKAVWVSRAKVELVPGDVTNKELLARAMQGCELVFHCVGIGGTLEECRRVNVDGTRNVLECAHAAKVRRVVNLSTSGVHGPNPPDGANEELPCRYTGASYGDSKIDAEKVVTQFWQEKRLPIVTLRPTFVWGPRSPWFTVWPVQCMQQGQWFLVDGGRGTCQALYVDNLVDAILLAGIKPDAAGEAFLLTDGQTYSWQEFFGYYARMVGAKNLPSVPSWAGHLALPITGCIDHLLRKLGDVPECQPARTFVRATRKGLKLLRRLPAKYSVVDAWDLVKYARRGVYNIAKARTLLGYSPRYSLEDGMRDTEIWLRDQRVLGG